MPHSRRDIRAHVDEVNLCKVRLGAIALGLGGAGRAADASIRVPAGGMSAMRSLAPLLWQVKAAVATAK